MSCMVQIFSYVAKCEYHCLKYVVFKIVVAEHLQAQHGAIKMLHGRVQVVLEYIKAVEAGRKNWF